MKGDIRPDDVLCIWNRYGTNHEYAKQFEEAGATVLVAENGYIGCDAEGKQLYALARSWHNGAGTWYVGEAPRWKDQNITLRPWRETGEEILVLPQRGFGPKEVAMPEGWVDATVAAIKRKTSRPVRVRKHPGNHPPEIPIEEDLNNVWVVVTWGSSAAIKALAAGVPAFYCFRSWIAASAAQFGLEDLQWPYRASRERAFQRIGWAQWRIEEIQSGLPFHYLLERKSAAA
jgi:hypothetical protein